MFDWCCPSNSGSVLGLSLALFSIPLHSPDAVSRLHAHPTVPQHWQPHVCKQKGALWTCGPGTRGLK